MNGVFKVSDVKEVKGFIYSGYVPNKYNNKHSLTTTKQEPKALLVRGELNGEDTSFFSPTVIVRNTSGYVNFRTMDENSWFDLQEGELKSFKGHEMFDGGSTPNVAIVRDTTITPKIKVGDIINISYKEKGEFNGTKTIKSVKIVKS